MFRTGFPQHPRFNASSVGARSSQPAFGHRRAELRPTIPDHVVEPSVARAEEARPRAEHETVKQALADLESAGERVAREADRVYDETRTKLVGEIFPVLDNLDRTLAASNGESSPLVDGVRMIREQLEQVLARFGVERIISKGATFDPSAHQAIATAPAALSDVGRVVEEIEAGYRYKGKLLRAAKVIVGVARE